MASCKDCPCDSASCRDSRQEAESQGQSVQEAIYQAQQSRQEARDHGQSLWKPNMTDSLCSKHKLADSFIPCREIGKFHGTLCLACLHTLTKHSYHISSVIRQIIFLPKQSQRSRSILKDGSRSLGLFRKGKIGIIAKFHRIDLVI